MTVSTENATSFLKDLTLEGHIYSLCVCANSIYICVCICIYYVSMTDSTENATLPKSTDFRISTYSVQIQFKVKSQFEFVPQDTEESEYMCVNVHKYVCIHIYIYIYIYMYTCVYMYINLCYLHAYLLLLAYLYKCIYIYVYVYVYIHTYMYICVYICAYLCIYVYDFKNIYIFICISVDLLWFMSEKLFSTKYIQISILFEYMINCQLYVQNLKSVNSRAKNT